MFENLNFCKNCQKEKGIKRFENEKDVKNPQRFFF